MKVIYFDYNSGSFNTLRDVFRTLPNIWSFIVEIVSVFAAHYLEENLHGRCMTGS